MMCCMLAGIRPITYAQVARYRAGGHRCRVVRTKDSRALQLHLLSSHHVQFEYHNTTVAVQGPAVASCERGSLLYSAIGMLSEEEILSVDDTQNHYAGSACPLQTRSAPFARIAGMVMMFAFVLVLALAVVVCCRGRRALQLSLIHI